MQNERKEFWNLLLKLALPIAFQHLLINSLTFVDTLFMSQLGDIALSASGMAGQWNWLLNMISFGLCSGSALFIAQYWGAGKLEEIRRTYSIALVSAFSAAIVFSAFAMSFPDKIMSVFNRDERIISTGSSYLRIVAFSYPATITTKSSL